MIGDAGFAAADRFPHVVDLGAAWRELTGLPFVYAVWAGRPGAVGPRTSPAPRRASRGPGGTAPRSRAPGPKAHGGDPADLRALPDRQHPLPPGRRGALRAWRPSSTARRARRRSSPAQPRPRLRELAEQPAAHRASPPAGARRTSIDALLADAAAGAASSPEDALRLYAEAPALELGAAADPRRRALHPDGVVTYIIDRNVNYTNVCVTRCKFCNFYRPPTNKTEGYVLDARGAAQKFQETVDLGGVQILLQGGPQPRAAARLVRGSLSLDEGELPARDPRPVARGDPLHRRDREPDDPRR